MPHAKDHLPEIGGGFVKDPPNLSVDVVTITDHRSEAGEIVDEF